MMATETRDFVSDMFKQATERFGQTMQAGVEFQAQATKFWTNAFGKGVDQFGTQVDKMSKDAVPAAKKNLQQFHIMFDDQVKKCFETLRRTFDGGQDRNAPELLEQTMKMWQTSFDMVRANADMMSKSNIEMFETLNEMAKKLCATNGQRQSAKPPAK